MSSIVNKIKEAVHHDKVSDKPSHAHAHAHDNTTSTLPRPVGETTGNYQTGGGFGGGPAPNTAGPHKSDKMNELDPRVDSDRDGSKTLGDNRNTNTLGGTSAQAFGSGPQHTAGPHRSDKLNELDPRVDSDRDGSRTLGGATNTAFDGQRNHGAQHTNFAGQGGYIQPSHGQHATHAPGMTTTSGPHQSDLANKLDPRVDSDRDNSNTLGGNTYGNQQGVLGHSNLGQTHGHSAGGFAPGPAPNTAGPHRSDKMNELDPRVDSDLDGSKIVGGNKTYGQPAGRNLADAAQVPPSVFRKHVGEVAIEHGDHSFQRERRNSKVSHQDQFRGI